ncbi:MAG TPA: GNAT family N-acetyltransferase [Pyrinomonadaceae bacterium]
MVDRQQTVAEKVVLRPVVLPEDEAFLQHLYFCGRDDLTGVFPDETQLRQMLMIQYLGQKQTYTQEFPDADHDIILFEEQPVGRLMIDRRAEDLFGIDIAVLPRFRTLGIGTAVLRRLFDECSQLGVPFRLSVVKGNPAIRLYERLGCEVEGESATHFFMKWDGHNSK